MSPGPEDQIGETARPEPRAMSHSVIISLRKAATLAESTDGADVRDVEVTQEAQQPVIVDLAVEIWRLRRRINRLGNEADDRERLAPLEDTTQRLEDLLAQHEIETRDHDGEIWQQGSAVEVLHAREGEAPLVVVETVRPTIRISGKVVQQGQVITGPGPEPESKGISD